MTPSGKPVSHGRYGDVWQHGNHAPYVAVKRIKLYKEDIKKYAERELKYLELFHPNIVKFYGHNQKTLDRCEYLMIHMEFCERLSLRHVLDDPTVVYNLKTVFGWAEHLASSLLFLKEHKILHRDLKPLNVFVTNRFFLKLGDFGFGKDFEPGTSMSEVGTLRYMSPEATTLFGKIQIDYRSDLYAMGLVLWEMVERRIAFSEFEGLSLCGMFYQLKDGRYSLRLTDCDTELADWILQCIKFDPSPRPDIEDFFPKIALLNSNYDEETFQPLIQINQQEIQKPNCTRKESTNKRELLQKELTDQLKRKQEAGIFSASTFYYFDKPEVHLDDEQEQEKSMNRSSNDAILFLKSLAIQQDDSKLLDMFEKRLQNFSKLPDDYILSNVKYPNFSPIIDLEILDFLAQNYEADFAAKIRSALEMCEHCFRNEFKTWLIETFAALDWYSKALQRPCDYLLEAIEQIYSTIDRILGNQFYKQWLVVEDYQTDISRWGIGFLISQKPDSPQTNVFLHKGLSIESCLKDLQEILESLLKDSNIDDAILKDYLRRYQLRECVFPFRAYRFEWGKRVDECEEIKMSNIDPEALADFESLRQAYECALRILVTHSKREENSINENDQIDQIETCLSELEKPRKCPNYFYFHARELRDEESQNGDILCINQKEANKVIFFLGDDLMWSWKNTTMWSYLRYAIIGVDLLIDRLSKLLLKYRSI